MTPRFVICSPCYNAEPFVPGSIKSALDQVYDQYRMLWLDDACTDASVQAAKITINSDPRVTRCENTRRRGAVHNYWWLAQQCDPDEVMVFLDADDRLATPGVLRRLAGLYLDPDVWVTYGQFQYDQVSGGGIGMAAALPADNHTRKAGWRTTHLKTCYAGLMHQLDVKGLLDPATGDFWLTAGDLAFFYPVVEMAGPRHARFVPEILYIYNLQNPINDCKVDAAAQRATAAYIDAQPVYPLLATLPWRTP